MHRFAPVLALTAAAVVALAGCSSSPDRTSEVNAACATALNKSLTNVGQDESKPQEGSVKVAKTAEGWTETGTVFVTRTDADGMPIGQGGMKAYECTATDQDGKIVARATISLR